jgi:hypothetical protein
MDSLYKHSEWMGSPQQERMEGTFFQDSPIKIDWKMHDTQRIIDDKQLVFGGWAGPLCCITNVIHEMCHLVEIDDARILRNGWGLIMPEQYIPGRYSCMAPIPVTNKASLRETRVAALQYQVQNMLGIPTSIRDVILSFQFLPDFCNIPDGVDREKDFEYKEIDEGRYQYLERYLAECMGGKYTLTFFHQEWARKNQLLRKALL